MGSPITSTTTKKVNNQPPIVPIPKPEPPTIRPEPKGTPEPQTKANDLLFSGNVMKNRLANTQTGGNTGNSEKVNDAVESIKDSLRQKWNDWDVTKGDLNNIRNEFKDLSRSEANAVFNDLSDGDLNRWADELDSGINGYSTSERKELFDKLSSQLDSGNAVRFLNALDGQENRQAFANSFANNAQDSQVERIINGTLDQVTTNEDSAIIVAELIGGLNGNQAATDRVLGSMDQSQLNAIVESAVQKDVNVATSPYGGGHVTVSHDPAPLAGIIDAARSSSDSDLKARVFDAAANQLSNIEESGGFNVSVFGKREDAGVVREALTGLLNGDTTGIISELEKDSRGGGLESYVKSMLNTGNEADQQQIGTLIGRLLTGNSNSQNQISRFEQQVPGTTGAAYYQNARTLGFFAGSVHAATSSITGDRDRQGDILKNVFDTAAGVIGAKFPVSSALGKGLSIELVDQVVGNLNDKSYDLRNAIIDLTLPHDTNDNLYTGPARTSWDAAFASTALLNDN